MRPMIVLPRRRFRSGTAAGAAAPRRSTGAAAAAAAKGGRTRPLARRKRWRARAAPRCRATPPTARLPRGGPGTRGRRPLCGEGGGKTLPMRIPKSSRAGGRGHRDRPRRAARTRVYRRGRACAAATRAARGTARRLRRGARMRRRRRTRRMPRAPPWTPPATARRAARWRGSGGNRNSVRNNSLHQSIKPKWGTAAAARSHRASRPSPCHAGRVRMKCENSGCCSLEQRQFTRAWERIAAPFSVCISSSSPPCSTVLPVCDATSERSALPSVAAVSAKLLGNGGLRAHHQQTRAWTFEGRTRGPPSRSALFRARL